MEDIHIRTWMLLPFLYEPKDTCTLLIFFALLTHRVVARPEICLSCSVMDFHWLPTTYLLIPSERNRVTALDAEFLVNIQ